MLRLEQQAAGRAPLSDLAVTARDAQSFKHRVKEVEPSLARFAHMFDPWLACSHPALNAAVDNPLAGWAALEPHRKRRLRETDRQSRDAIVRAVAANLAFPVAMGFEPPLVGISLKAGKQKRTRYDREGFSGLTRILAVLGDQSGGVMLDLSRSSRHGTASSITASPWFRGVLHGTALGPEHFGQLPGREPLWLSRTERDATGNIEGRELVDYAETDETRRYRAELERINARIAAADLCVEDDAGPPLAVGVRTLRRVFNLPPDAEDGIERFDLGGRLFGGWWQTVPKARRHILRIEGQPVADLDFASMALRLAYAETGLRPPDGDLYARVPGLSDSRWRPGVKKVVSAMLFRRTPLTRLPRGTRALLPEGIQAAELRTAILAAHPALSDVFETGIGLRLMFLESHILIATLLGLAERNVAALPMHDGLMVAHHRSDLAAGMMTDASAAVTGHPLPITARRL